METFGRIKPENRVELPDFEWWTVFFVLLFVAIVVINYFRSRSSEPESVSTSHLSYDYAIGTIAMTVVYVLLMGLGLLPFVWATILFVIGGGLFLTRMDRSKWVPILEVALLMSFGCTTYSLSSLPSICPSTVEALQTASAYIFSPQGAMLVAIGILELRWAPFPG